MFGRCKCCDSAPGTYLVTGPAVNRFRPVEKTVRNCTYKLQLITERPVFGVARGRFHARSNRPETWLIPPFQVPGRVFIRPIQARVSMGFCGASEAGSERRCLKTFNTASPPGRSRGTAAHRRVGVAAHAGHKAAGQRAAVHPSAWYGAARHAACPMSLTITAQNLHSPHR